MPDFDSIKYALENFFLFKQGHPLLFTQFYFWAFFALVYAIFSLVKSKRLMRNAFLFFASLFFYYKNSGLFVILLIFVTFSDFNIARQIYKAKRPLVKRLWLICSVLIDLSLLCYYKYSYFFTDVVNNIFGTQFRVFDAFASLGNELFGTTFFNVDQIFLPVGISFFTFQVISYTVDVYQGKIKPVSNILDFGFYVSFFPQLVAGPIVRASEFIPQLYKPFFLSRRQFGIAIFWILNGLTKKLVLSDYIAVNFVDRVFNNPLLFSGFENISALFGYSLQVYADFSGYTDIAIGVAMLMGFYLPQNFNSPYKAPNPQNFWKRWHMSLSRWLQTYLYIPLGGNRNATFSTYFWIITIAAIALILSGSLWVAFTILFISVAVLLVAFFKPSRRKKITANVNSFITMILGGLWHGASWNFVIWGGLNGVGMIVFKLWRDMSWLARTIIVSAVTGFTLYLKIRYGNPIFNIFFVWMSAIFIVTWIRFIYHLTGCTKGFKTLGNVWAVLLTFVFITFTRLFFRSGSNLDPAVANEVAWSTAKNMVSQIGSHWNLSIIPDIIANYWKVFALIVFGMIVHWLPERFKRWYRINFALLPLPVMVLAVVIIVVILYQFVTADAQPFIYFQF